MGCRIPPSSRRPEQFLLLREENCASGLQTQISEVRSLRFNKLASPDLASAGNTTLRLVWMMGGGPRVFPGGATKRQWKKRHEKEQRELERIRWSREKQLFKGRQRLEKSPSNISSPPHLLPKISHLSIGTPLLDEPHLSNGTPSLDEPHFSVGTPLLDEPSAEAVKETCPDGASAKAESMRSIAVEGQGRWSGSRREVAEQIERVRHLVRNRNRVFPLPDDSGTASSFSQLHLSPTSVKALHMILGVRNMTPVQEATLPVILQGRDMLARTKGGSEDVVASLLHAIELILRSRKEYPTTEIGRLQQQLTVSDRFPITALLLCATRERAAFVAADAKQLVMFHSTINVQVVKGGNDLRKEERILRTLPCEILVATPGRLLDHLTRSPEFRGQIRDVKLFVLDEAQKLLDLGYARTIQRIARFLPRARQTVMWSAALQSEEVFELSGKILKRSREVVNTISPGEDEDPLLRVRQEFVVVGMERQFEVLFSLLRTHCQAKPEHKVVVFCQTVRSTVFMALLYKNLGFDTREVHMRRNEKYRERVSGEFRTSRGGLILFTCGASVWGVANPDVTLVVQVGAASGREQYVRRVTLSGLEITDRDCILLLTPEDRAFFQTLSGLPLLQLPCPDVNLDSKARVQQAMQQISSLVRVNAYAAWLRYHVNQRLSTPEKKEVIQQAALYSGVLGFRSPPQLSSRVLKDLNLDREQFLPVAEEREDHRVV